MDYWIYIVFEKRNGEGLDSFRIINVFDQEGQAILYVELFNNLGYELDWRRVSLSYICYLSDVLV